LEKLEARKRKMGWTFPWVSSGDSDFNYDFAVSFRDEDMKAGIATYNDSPRVDAPDGGVTRCDDCDRPLRVSQRPS
jgi:predicted dithiol-disulfide oxidoreductase (DUF899 family)